MEFGYQVTVSLASFVSLGIVVAALVSSLELNFTIASSLGVTAILAVYRPRYLFRQGEGDVSA